MNNAATGIEYDDKDKGAEYSRGYVAGRIIARRQPQDFEKLKAFEGSALSQFDIGVIDGGSDYMIEAKEMQLDQAREQETVQETGR